MRLPAQSFVVLLLARVPLLLCLRAADAAAWRDLWAFAAVYYTYLIVSLFAISASWRRQMA
jgi:membrane protein YdbS with pleckstrin-like domain